MISCKRQLFFFLILINVLPLVAEVDFAIGTKLWYGPHENGDMVFNCIEVEQHVKGTTYEVCGFNKGFIGLIDDTEKAVIFKLWDRNNGRDEADKVKPRKRAKLENALEGTKSERFGGNGSGVSIKLPYSWKTNEKYSFAISYVAKEETSHYTGWFHHPEQKKWLKIGEISYQRPREDELQSYYSMIRDLKLAKTDKMRKAYFSTPWCRKAADKKWFPFISADFQADKPVDSVNAGQTKDDRFYIETGGATVRRVEFYFSFVIANKKKPAELVELLSLRGKRTK